MRAPWTPSSTTLLLYGGSPSQTPAPPVPTSSARLADTTSADGAGREACRTKKVHFSVPSHVEARHHKGTATSESHGLPYRMTHSPVPHADRSRTHRPALDGRVLHVHRRLSVTEPLDMTRSSTTSLTSSSTTSRTSSFSCEFSERTQQRLQERLLSYQTRLTTTTSRIGPLSAAVAQDECLSSTSRPVDDEDSSGSAASDGVDNDEDTRAVSALAKHVNQLEAALTQPPTPPSAYPPQTPHAVTTCDAHTAETDRRPASRSPEPRDHTAASHQYRSSAAHDKQPSCSCSERDAHGVAHEVRRAPCWDARRHCSSDAQGLSETPSQRPLRRASSSRDPPSSSPSPLVVPSPSPHVTMRGVRSPADQVGHDEGVEARTLTLARGSTPIRTSVCAEPQRASPLPPRRRAKTGCLDTPLCSWSTSRARSTSPASFTPRAAAPIGFGCGVAYTPLAAHDDQGKRSHSLGASSRAQPVAGTRRDEPLFVLLDTPLRVYLCDLDTQLAALHTRLERLEATVPWTHTAEQER